MKKPPGWRLFPSGIERNLRVENVSAPVDPRTDDFQRGLRMAVGADLFPHTLLHRTRGPHHLAVLTDHVDLRDAIDAPGAVQLDRADGFLERGWTAAEVIGEYVGVDAALLHADVVAIDADRVHVDVVPRFGIRADFDPVGCVRCRREQRQACEQHSQSVPAAQTITPNSFAAMPTISAPTDAMAACWRSSLSSPFGSNASLARLIAIWVGITMTPILERIERSTARPRTPPRWPGDADTRPATLPLNATRDGSFGSGREAQSMAFFNTPEMALLYSGELIRNPW